MTKDTEHLTLEDLKDVVVAYNWLENHPIFQGRFNELLDIEYKKVKPSTLSISDNEEENTLSHVWLNCKLYSKIVDEEDAKDLYIPVGEYVKVYDDKISYISGNTFEEAIGILAEVVFKQKGNYTFEEYKIAKLIPIFKTKEKATEIYFKNKQKSEEITKRFLENSN